MKSQEIHGDAQGGPGTDVVPDEPRDFDCAVTHALKRGTTVAPLQTGGRDASPQKESLQLHRARRMRNRKHRHQIGGKSHAKRGYLYY